MKSIFVEAKKPAFDQVRVFREGVSAEAVFEAGTRVGLDSAVLGKKADAENEEIQRPIRGIG